MNPPPTSETEGSDELNLNGGCCASAQRGGLRRESAAIEAGAEAIADATPPARMRFEGGRSYLGTWRPEIPQDGEGPRRQVRLASFAADTCLVTNARFSAFVAATGYTTEAEQFGWGLVFRGLLAKPDRLPLSNSATPWWVKVDGACWHAPEGPESELDGREQHPVTHVSWSDARAFAAWCGGRLPTEAEWEHAARGGLEDPRFPWGDREPDETSFFPCNIWQGQFPQSNRCADGWYGTSPVAAFSPNGAGMYDMVGNVWEWTTEPFLVRSAAKAARERNARARAERQKVMKGGSFLCHASYCYRYRIAARSGVASDSGACNTGFRIFYEN
jgi:formylglycine-generating enzyme